MLDGGYAGMPPMIIESIEKLGFQRVLHVVSTCSLNRMALTQYPEQAADFERSFGLLRDLPADIWVTGHGRAWGRYRKYVASLTAENFVDAFIDPAGYRAFIDAGEDEFRRGVTH